MKSTQHQLAMAKSKARRDLCLVPFTEDEWYTWDWNGEEEYTVPLIKKYLRSSEQKKALDDFDVSIEDCLNGRVEGEEAQAYVAEMFTDWNLKLGYKHFGSGL